MKKELVFILGLCAILASCASKSIKNQSPSQESTLVGNDKDAHGCLGSAGQTWSEALQDCIRVWEKGIKMEPSKKSDSTSANYIVFSKDSSKVELFIAGSEVHMLLDRKNSVSNPGQQVWSSDTASNGLKVYKDASKLWVIERDGKVQFRQIAE